MKKRFIAMIIIIAVVLMASFAHFELPYEHTLNAVKLDAQGNEIGTVDIPIQGIVRRSLLLPDELLAQVREFDSISGFDVDSAKYEKFVGDDFLHCTFATTDLGSKDDILHAFTNGSGELNPTSYTYSVSISEDFDRWLIHVVVDDNEPVYYLATVSGKYTTQELQDFFEARLP